MKELKEHIKENGVYYVAGGVCVLTGIMAATLYYHKFIFPRLPRAGTINNVVVLATKDLAEPVKSVK